MFREVQAGNVFVRLFRRITPFWRTPDEHPLTEEDYAIYKSHFSEVNVTTHVLTSMLYLFAHRMFALMLRVLRIRRYPPESIWLLALCDRVDAALARIRAMKSQMWFSLIEMRR